MAKATYELAHAAAMDATLREIKLFWPCDQYPEQCSCNCDERLAKARA